MAERIDLDRKGALDEIVLYDIATVHLERCTKGMWFLSLTRADRSQLAVWISKTPSYEFRDGFAVAPERASPRLVAGDKSGDRVPLRPSNTETEGH
jgi:hypothetical protein